MTLTYADAWAMLRDLKAIGATNATKARPRSLMGRRRWERALAALEAARRDGRIPATFEVIYGHAWKVAPKRTAEGHAIVRVRAVTVTRFQSPNGCETLDRGTASAYAGPR